MLYQMFAQTVQAHPQHTAIVYDKIRMSYQDVDARVIGLSRGLRSLGIQQSHRVALVLPNCPEFIISYYALAHLQGIFVSLDPASKEEELMYFLKDSTPGAIITDMKRAERCRDVLSRLNRNIPLIVTDGTYPSSVSFSEIMQSETGVVVREGTYEGDMVYHYSSGSTGKPKRVCRTQQNLFADGDNTTATLGVTASDIILCTTPLFHSWGQQTCVLISVRAGATLVLLEPFTHDGLPLEVAFAARCPRVLELIEQERVTILPSVPHIFSILADTPVETRTDFSSVRFCVSASHALSKETRDRFLQRFGIPIRQGYGATEGGLFTVNMEPDTENIYDTVGLPCRGVTIRILNDDQTEVQPGVVGEVVVKSPGLTSGYANLPALNQETFRNGYYFTGDLGKKDEHGRLYLVGRKKFLIDTGGYKVDPLEIEEVLLTHPAVAEVAVVGAPALPGASGADKEHIVKAFVLAKVACTQDELLAYCRERLADFKVPRSIEFRSALPKSALGKILRGELEEQHESIGSKQTLILRPMLLAAPPEERKHLLEAYLLAQVKEVLLDKTVNVDAQQALNTLELDSLMIIDLKNRLEMDLGITISIVALLQGLNIAQLTIELLPRLSLEDSRSLPASLPINEVVTEYPLSYGQRALWYIYQLAPESAAYNTFFAVRILSALDIPALQSALQSLVNRHASLRSSYIMRDDQPVQHVHEYMPVYFKEVDASTWSQEDLQRHLIVQAHHPFDLERDCLLRGHLYTGLPQGPILLLATHHIATDFRSTVVLLEELAKLYHSATIGIQESLPPVDATYREFVQWEADVVKGQTSQEHLTYWRQQLTDIPTEPDLSPNRPRPTVQTYSGAILFFEISENLVSRLRHLAKVERITLATILLTVFQVAASRYSGQEDIVIGAATTSRNRPQFQNLVGYFVNPVALRLPLIGDPSFSQLAQQVHSILFSALEHQAYPFSLLVEQLQPQRDHARSPIFNVMFTLNRLTETVQPLPHILAGIAGTRMDLGGLLVESLPLQPQTAKFDLTLLVYEAENTCSFCWEYNTDLFDQATISSLAHYFHLLLEYIAYDFDQRISNLPTLAQITSGTRSSQTEGPLSIERESQQIPSEQAEIAERMFLEQLAAMSEESAQQLAQDFFPQV